MLVTFAIVGGLAVCALHFLWMGDNLDYSRAVRAHPNDPQAVKERLDAAKAHERHILTVYGSTFGSIFVASMTGIILVGRRLAARQHLTRGWSGRLAAT